jgi:4-amino-4-deoxy-L-arabinose transferase-like glycosyltransferase
VNLSEGATIIESREAEMSRPVNEEAASGFSQISPRMLYPDPVQGQGQSGSSLLARTRARRAALLVGLWVLLGGAIRLGINEATFPTDLVGDEFYYSQTAVHLAVHDEHYCPPYGTWAGWPPAYPWVLSRWMFPVRVGPDEAIDLALAQRAQVAIGSLLVVATAVLAGALFGPREAVVAAAMAALYPTFVAYSHFLWSETFFALLLTTALVGVVRCQRRPGYGLAALTGLAFGVSALTREVGLVLAAACAGWWWYAAAPPDRRAAAARGALMLGVACLVILPWTLRNYSVLDRFVPVSTAGWLNARSGNTLAGDNWLRPDLGPIRAFRNAYFDIPDEMARADFARDQTLALIRSEQPLWLPKKLVRTTGLLFAPDSFVFKKISRGAYDGISATGVRAVLVLTVAAYVGVVLLGVAGVAAATGPGRRALPVLLFGVTLALHVAVNASSRYRLPLMPLLMAYAGHAWVHRHGLWTSLSRRSRLAAGGVLLVFLGFCVPYFAPEAVSLWTRGTYVEPGRP